MLQIFRISKSLLYLVNLKSLVSEANQSISLPQIYYALAGKEVQLLWPLFLMSWRRRIGREEEALFFTGCEDADLVAQHVGSRVYCISLKKDI